MIQRYLRIPIVRQFVRYASVGVVNVITYLIFFNLLLRAGMATLGASAVSFVVTNFISYVLNKRWAFRDAQTEVVRQYIVFLGFTLVGLGLHSGALWLLLFPLESYGTIGKNAAALGAMPVSVVWNFTAYRRWTFAAADGGSSASPAPSA